MSRMYGLSALTFAVCIFLFSPAYAHAVSVQVFNAKPYGNSVTNPVPVGANTELRWYCKEADGTRLWAGDTHTLKYNQGGVLTYAPGEYGKYTTPALQTNTTYWLGCQDNKLFGYSYAWAKKMVYVGTPPPPVQPNEPTLSISGNSQSGSVSVTVGTPVTIVGTYAAASGDTLTATALNDYANNALPGVPNNTATSPKSYTFTPAAAGSYVFYPAAQTTAYPGWNNYGKSFTVTANATDVCSNISGVQTEPPANGTSQGGVCSCNNGYALQGDACVAACAGAHQTGTPPNCACEVGYQMQNGSCVQQQCPGPNEINWPTCSCAAGYSRDSGTNQCIQTPALSITVNSLAATRVRKGNSVALAWSASGVLPGSCSVRTNAGTTVGTGDTGSRQVIIGAQTTFRLTCQNQAGTAVSKEATVTPVPDFIET